MATDLDFLDEVTAFSETSTPAVGSTPLQTWAAISPSRIVAKHDKSDASEGEKSPTTPGKRRSEALDARRKKYRQKSKNEHDELRRTADDLARKIQEMIDAREGRNTTARSDLVLCKAFWRKVAMEQKQHRLRSEAERKVLLKIVNSQSVYIESMKTASQCPVPSRTLSINDLGASHDPINDHKWLRLKSSVSSLYSTYLQEVDGGYTRIDQTLREAEVGSLSLGIFDSSYRYKPSGELQFFQHRYRVLQPFALAETSRAMWNLATITNRQTDRQGYNAITDPDNTDAVRFRVQKTLASGSTVSIMRHVVSRRFVEQDRVVIVWKIFSEGEGVYSGMDMDETAMISIRPVTSGARSGTLLDGEFHLGRHTGHHPQAGKASSNGLRIDVFS
ncbi:hypothetical protein GN958_ATG16103 [Phytophthora infestans]|uniref:M96 mating-specific protein family n=1 Tax=Phytophthora infestans TaxID=4787 RepID=A0A8S9U5Z5_PHYIN|nr:hypothetical protein GN958_ATG16103 [Phytophthora infestans]